MKKSDIKEILSHEKWLKSRRLIAANRIRTAAYFAFNVWRVRHGCNYSLRAIPYNTKIHSIITECNHLFEARQISNRLDYEMVCTKCGDSPNSLRNYEK